ncbi:unnamed protein product, partial [Porites evermanni]
MDYPYLTLCVFNAYMSYTATMLNIVAIYAIRKTLSLPKNLKTLLLSLAVSDLGVGLLAQPMHVAYIMDYKQNNVPNETYSVIYIAFLIPTNLFMFASLFGVTALCAERFLAIYLHLRYQELVTCKRVAAVVVSIWVISAIISLIRLFIPKDIMYMSFFIIKAACITTATSLSVKLYLTLRRHINQIQVRQEAQNDQEESVQRKRKSAMASLYVYLVFIVCDLPAICVLIIVEVKLVHEKVHETFDFTEIESWKDRNESYNAIYIADLIPTNIFTTATLFSVMALCAERFLAIQLHLRYQELVMYRRVIIAVISIWVFSTFTSLLKL